MAFGPSITFLAQRWNADLTQSCHTDAAPIPVEPFCTWLRNLGYVAHPGSVQHYTLGYTDIYVHFAGAEVVFLTVDFGLTDDAPERINDWQAFANRLSTEWGLSPIEGEQRLAADQFRRLIAQNRNWQLISNTKGWAPI